MLLTFIKIVIEIGIFTYILEAILVLEKIWIRFCMWWEDLDRVNVQVGMSIFR